MITGRSLDRVIYCIIALVGISCLTAYAQDFGPPPMPMPMPPAYMPTPVTSGRFSLGIGLKYRTFNKVRFYTDAFDFNYEITRAVVPFGPSVPGDFGQGTGRDGFLGGGATWLYDNGRLISAASFAPCGDTTCDDGGGAHSCGYGAGAFTWSTLVPQMGRFAGVSSAGTCADPPVASACCLDVASPFAVGRFNIVDPTTQVNNPADTGAATAVTFSLVIPGSNYATGSQTLIYDRDFQESVITPTLMLSFQAADFFDIFYEFTGFKINREFANTISFLTPVSRLTIVDTFPFDSDQTGAFTTSNFDTADSIVGGSGNFNYRLWTNSAGQGFFPNRQFLYTADTTEPLQELIENRIQRLDVAATEHRLGGQSWVPLFGFGRATARFGGVFLPIQMRTSMNKLVRLGPGGLVFNTLNLFSEQWRMSYGFFAGGGLDLGFGNYFVQMNSDYAWLNSHTANLEFSRVEFNPGGYSFEVNGGISF
jgi:hypothetical protein